MTRLVIHSSDVHAFLYFFISLCDILLFFIHIQANQMLQMFMKYEKKKRDEPLNLHLPPIKYPHSKVRQFNWSY